MRRAVIVQSHAAVAGDDPDITLSIDDIDADISVTL